uniref:Putative bovine pancreatic trypsin inhibitor n=1 Tax=Rhipicephalus microplus TaxID=6941 RepID=A0A6G5A9E9_RHIMP
MNKTAFVVLLLLSNVVPLLAWGSMAQRWPRRDTRRQVKAQMQYKAPAGLLRWPTYNMSKCVRGSCVYPPMCHCPIPDVQGFLRYPEGEGPWYYNSTSHKCQESHHALHICNSFKDEKHCEERCAGAMKWSPDVINKIYEEEDGLSDKMPSVYHRGHLQFCK